jgi:hypothetical protein
MQSPTNPPTGPGSTSWSDEPFQSSPHDPAAATGRSSQHSATSQAQEAAASATERAKGVAAQAAERAKARASETGEQAKEGAANEIERTAQALEAAADELEDSSMQRELFLEAAHGLMEVSDAVRGRSVGAIVNDLAEFGRRNPYGLIGGAALAGFAVARFARASTRPRSGYQAGSQSGYQAGDQFGRRPETSSTTSSPELRRPSYE